MPINIVCPNGHRLKVKDSLAGKTGLCPECKAKITVPAAAVAAKPVAGQAAPAAARDLSEDVILGILGPYEPDEARIQMPIEDPIPPRSAKKKGPAVKTCDKCHEEVPPEAHVCPFCRTYISGLFPPKK
jgi:uncharacterized paraquat-inducible protein A